MFVSHLEHDSGYLGVEIHHNLTEKTDDWLMVVYCGHHIWARHHNHGSGPGPTDWQWNNLSPRPGRGSIQRIGKLCQFLHWALSNSQTGPSSRLTTQEMEMEDTELLSTRWTGLSSFTGQMYDTIRFSSNFNFIVSPVIVLLRNINWSLEMFKTNGMIIILLSIKILIGW